MQPTGREIAFAEVLTLAPAFVTRPTISCPGTQG
jgi:hypothetical protein